MINVNLTSRMPLTELTEISVEICGAAYRLPTDMLATETPLNHTGHAEGTICFETVNTREKGTTAPETSLVIRRVSGSYAVVDDESAKATPSGKVKEYKPRAFGVNATDTVPCVGGVGNVAPNAGRIVSPTLAGTVSAGKGAAALLNIDKMAVVATEGETGRTKAHRMVKGRAVTSAVNLIEDAVVAVVA